MFPFNKDKYLKEREEAILQIKKSDKYFIARSLYPFLKEFLSVARDLDLQELIFKAHYSHIPSLLNPKIAHFRFMQDYTSLEISGVSQYVDLSKIQKTYDYAYLATLGFIALQKIDIQGILKVLKCKYIEIDTDRHSFKYYDNFIETSSHIKIAYKDLKHILNIDRHFDIILRQRDSKATARAKETRLIF